MITLLLLTAIIVLAIGSTVHAARRDDRGLRPPPPSHDVDPDAIPPALRPLQRL